MVDNPRDIAVRALCERRGYVTMRLENLLSQTHLAAKDQSFARELALGACRRKATLAALLRAYMQHPGRPLPTPLEEILLVAIYQMVLLERVPDHASVNEAVAQAVRCRHKRKSGMVNGILRTIGRSLSPPLEGPPPLERDVVPVAPGVYRKLDRPIFADPRADPPGHLAEAYSLPLVLAQRWVERFGSLTAAVEIAMHADTRAPLIVRVNRLKGDLQAALDSLAADGAEPVPHENGHSIVLLGHKPLHELKAFHDGLIQPQDPSATQVVLTADPKPGSKVLDFCAAPGTKTTHLAERMHNNGSITAVDVSPEKLARVTDNCRRMGVVMVKTHLADRAGSLDAQGYDLVLADTPCTNTGVLARRAEARWRFNPDALGQLVRDQQMILAAASNFVKPGGKLVYSTCSIEPEECGDVVAWFVRRGGFTVIDEKLTLPAGADEPTRWRDGAYCAVLARS